uniref:Uncharacterized protein n=1 Tax=Oryza sativa subsp. japonica TaxID=39947 RepID=Q6Z146_ORYSJ|nr:hypothetical protein [Oryza sativa Japonica Group]BAD31404.1 hypothetical protein [Oryza sativa Japonica Group]
MWRCWGAAAESVVVALEREERGKGIEMKTTTLSRSCTRTKARRHPPTPTTHPTTHPPPLLLRTPWRRRRHRVRGKHGATTALFRPVDFAPPSACRRRPPLCPAAHPPTRSFLVVGSVDGVFQGAAALLAFTRTGGAPVGVGANHARHRRRSSLAAPPTRAVLYPGRREREGRTEEEREGRGKKREKGEGRRVRLTCGAHMGPTI